MEAGPVSRASASATSAGPMPPRFDGISMFSGDTTFARDHRKNNSNIGQPSFSNEVQTNDDPELWPMAPQEWAAQAPNGQAQSTAWRSAIQAPGFALEEAMLNSWPSIDHEEERLGFLGPTSEVTVFFPDPLESCSSSQVTGSRRHLARLESELFSHRLQLSEHIYANPPPSFDEAGIYVSPEALFDEAVAHLRGLIPDLPPIEQLAADVFNNRDNFMIGPNNSYLEIVTVLLQMVSKKMEGRITFDVGHLRKTGDGWHFTIEHASPHFEATHLLLACGDVLMSETHDRIFGEVWRIFTVPASTDTNTQSTLYTASAGLLVPTGATDVNTPALTLHPNTLPQLQSSLQSRPRPMSASTKEVKTTTARTGQMPKDPHAYTGEEYKNVPDAELLNGTIHTDKIFGELAGRIAKACGGDKEIQQKMNHLRVNLEGQQALRSKSWFAKRLSLWYERKAADSNGAFTKTEFEAQFLEERYGRPIHASRLNNQGQYKPGANLSAKTLAKRKRSISADGASDEGESSRNMAPHKKRSL
ncbi:hypothetical protein AC578_9645 [Pseudocercospora eumusae]|uniref:Uncharacterized protein n=1 Tax=Pseudocercospora eumusae TaxID=321146 RepID=A0A139H1G8_9PEZI|nr:hypothetical protein AC578_9645 [Pseudocercospora eumusae]